MMMNYKAKAQYILGYMELRFQRRWGDDQKDKEAERNIWAMELQQFDKNQLSDQNIMKAFDNYKNSTDYDQKRPSIDQFMSYLKSASHVEPKRVEYKQIDYAGLWDKAESQGRDACIGYMKNIFNRRLVSPATKYHIRKYWEKEGMTYGQFLDKGLI